MPERDWCIWWAHRLYARASLPLLLAVGLLVAAAGFEVAQADLREEARRLEQEALVPAMAPSAVVVAGNDNDRRLADFDSVLPERRRVPDILATLFALGEKRGVVLERGDYQLEQEPGGLVRCRIRFPVTGDTGKLEGFVREALLRFPTLALEGIRLQRDSATDSKGEVEIRFILFMKSAGADLQMASAA